MAATFTSYFVDNDHRFQVALARAGAKVKDLTIPLTLIRLDFYKSQRAIFKNKGPGQYPDLAEWTKQEKREAGYPVYPILKRTGALEEAATQPEGRGAVNRIEDGVTLVLGVDATVIPYAPFHQLGTRRMPMRKFLFIGPEAPRFATSEQTGRLERWISILNAYVLEVMSPLGEVA